MGEYQGEGETGRLFIISVCKVLGIENSKRGTEPGTHHKHTGEEAAKVDIGRVVFRRKVVGRSTARAYPIRERREDECEGWCQNV